jgi:Family of unknown function (DUF6286)
VTAVHETRTGAGPSRRAVRRAFGPRRVVPAVITATVLTTAATILAAEVIGTLVHRPPGVLPVAWLARLGRETHWDDMLVLAVAAALAALGLVLLALALWPGRLRAIALRPEAPDLVLGITPRGLRRYAARAAENVDGIARARARVRGRRIRVRADSPLHDVSDLTGQVRQAVAERLDELAPLRRPRLNVTVRHREV